MQINDEAITEFMVLYRAEFEKDISREEALEMATRLLNLYQLIMRPPARARESHYAAIRRPS